MLENAQFLLKKSRKSGQKRGSPRIWGQNFCSYTCWNRWLGPGCDLRDFWSVRDLNHGNSPKTPGEGSFGGPFFDGVQMLAEQRDGNEQNELLPFELAQLKGKKTKKKLIHVIGQASLAFWPILSTNMTLIPKIDLKIERIIANSSSLFLLDNRFSRIQLDEMTQR